jgi:succinylglutamic semialdehyde dehydrogenase
MSPSDLVSHDPCTGDIVWQGEVADGEAVEKAAAHAREGFRNWSQTSFDFRASIAGNFRDHVLAHADALARLISRETGKPFWEAKTECASVAAKVDISIKAYHDRTPTRDVTSIDHIQKLSHRPHGVLAVLGPYNFPAHLPNGHIVPALLAGNAVLFKPSELTPAVALWMADAWRAAGLPENILQVLPGARETGEALTHSDNLDGILFTGSARTGIALHRQFAGRPDIMLALEMGGNNPLLVWDVADVNAAAHLVVQSAFLSAGQRCTCARRLVVAEGKMGDNILDAVMALADRLIIGQPFGDPQPFMGPVVSNQAADGLRAAYAGLLENGGTILKPLEQPDGARPFLSPSLVDVTTLNNRRDEEYFGPLLQVIRVPDFQSAIGEANNTRFGLAAGLISDEVSLFDAFSSQSRAGIINWNRPLTGASSAAPFGGSGLSGNHRPSAYYAADYCAYPSAGLVQSNTSGQLISQGLRA